jgi:hypothetical protein
MGTMKNTFTNDLRDVETVSSASQEDDGMLDLVSSFKKNTG